jgi:hypothetical protein
VNTTSTYLAIEANLSHYQAMTAADPTVKANTAYYQANIGKVTSISQFVSNYRLLSYAMNAYGLGDQVNNKALITEVLQQGTTSSKALANTLENPNWKKFAAAFNFTATGSSAPTSSASVATTVSDYQEVQLEETQGQTDPGVQLALYFQREAPTVTSGYSILGDQNLLEVVQTAYNLAPTVSASQIDAEAASVSKLVPTSTLTNPTKLNQLIEKFTAAYDAKYGPASSDPGGLTVADGNNAPVTPASQTILANSISNTANLLSGVLPSNAFSAGLLYSLQGIKLGGL